MFAGHFSLQFAQADFIETVRYALATAACPRPWLELEITESILMKNMRDATS